MKYRMNQRLVIPEDWIDKNLIIKGWVVGIEKIQDRHYLATYGIKEYKNRFKKTRYKLIYQNGNRVFEKWYSEELLDLFN